jgi:hypothetical protein
VIAWKDEGGLPDAAWTLRTYLLGKRLGRRAASVVEPASVAASVIVAQGSCTRGFVACVQSQPWQPVPRYSEKYLQSRPHH